MEKTFVITKYSGFARTATSLASISNKFKSEMILVYDGKKVYIENTAESVMNIMSLNIIPGDHVHIIVNGTDKVHAIQAINNCFNIHQFTH